MRYTLRKISETRGVLNCRPLILAMIAIIAAIPSQVQSYELATHAALTREALMRSSLSPTMPDLWSQLGISDKQLSLGTMYFDIGNNGVGMPRSNRPKDDAFFGAKKITDAIAKRAL